MCRLYGFRANEETKVECSLVHAQNALMVQSRQDSEGYSHRHGWGVATYEDHLPHIERQAWAAYKGEHFRRVAAQLYAKTVIAHVRLATVGPPAIENTHPFSHGPWALVHNGTIPQFEGVRARMLEGMTPEHRLAIKGATDSEHFFHLLLSAAEREPTKPLPELLRQVVGWVRDWCLELDPEARIGLNVIVTDGDRLAGTRLGRSLFYAERDGIYDCEFCKMPHIHHDPDRTYRAVVVASESITHEDWREVPEGSVYSVTPAFRLHLEEL